MDDRKLIFTENQKKLKKNILNNFQIDLLYKLVAEYLKLQSKDKNKEDNQDIINQFNSLIELLDTIDQNLNKDIYFEDYLKNQEKFNLNLPKNIKYIESNIEKNCYYKSVLKKWFFLLIITYDEKVQEEIFVEIYDAFHNHYYDKHHQKFLKKKSHSDDHKSIKCLNSLNTQKAIDRFSKQFNSKKFDKSLKLFN